MLLCKNEKMDGTLLILDKGLEKKNRAQHKYLQQRQYFYFLTKRTNPSKDATTSKNKVDTTTIPLVSRY